MRKRMFAAGAAGLMLAVTVAGCAQGGDDSVQGASRTPASATPSAAGSGRETTAPGTTYFKTEVTPETGVAPGTVLTAKSTGATPSTAYYCLIAAYDTDGGGVSAPDRSTLKPVKSNAAGKITCEVTYKPFSAQDNAGVTRRCPTTAADREAGFTCGVLLADAATVGALSASAVPFTPEE
ncbi:hypothetical protein HNP84_001112 [Thermocatellispora tengchongensis]|uniref:Uncharacterized protein n=1 Tax=Thermocatellispora tengchongensis TaxID=1073253 RepID=A0A840NYY1_9ACTN|nr:hypothetical protein [Thermocatellispora tengchongensis]MBB5131406.1 hypothetical protein [Thermocatellispora tengchongensis]